MLSEPGSTLPNQRIKRWAGFIIVTVVFAIGFTKEPLYSSNQNQYFLHGLVQAGHGFLENDWLANTVDPTPVFSFLVKYTSLLNAPYLFHIYHGLLLGIFLLSLIGIIRIAHPGPVNKNTIFLLTGGLIVLFSKGFSIFSTKMIGIDIGWKLLSGMAGQFIINPNLQPSSFGVLLLYSIYLFLARKPYPAIFMAVLAATIHPTYLLSAALLTIAFMTIQYNEHKKLADSLIMGLTALLLVAPILIYTVNAFSPTTEDIYNRAQEILVRFRIPHHAVPNEWISLSAYLKLALVSGAIWMTRKTSLALILLLPAAVGLFGTIIQILTENNFIALLFPWRVSIFLVPIATGIILFNVFNLMVDKYSSLLKKYRKPISIIGGMLILIVLAAGIESMRIKQIERQKRPVQAVMQYVTGSKTASDLYLIPCDTSFPVPFEEFRLFTGAPILVDFKSIPYQDMEVLEWFDRFSLTQEFYDQPTKTRLEELAESFGVTHLILPKGSAEMLYPNGLELRYEDDNYIVLRVVS